MKILLTMTASVEAGTGLTLLVAPSALALILLGSPLDSMAGLVIGRVLGAALMALGVACWIARDDVRSRTAVGLVRAMLLYNVAVVLVLGYACFALRLSGLGSWPAITLHSLMAAWCIACLRLARPMLPLMVAVLLMTGSMVRGDEPHRISLESYTDRAHATWVAQMAAVYLGFPFEHQTRSVKWLNDYPRPYTHSIVDDDFLLQHGARLERDTLIIDRIPLQPLPLERFTLGDLMRYWAPEWKLERAGFGATSGGRGGYPGGTYLDGNVLTTWPRDLMRGTVLSRTVVLPPGNPQLTVEVSADAGRGWELSAYADNTELKSEIILGGEQSQWKTIEMDLSRFAGKEVTLRLYQNLTTTQRHLAPSAAHWRSIMLK